MSLKQLKKLTAMFNAMLDRAGSENLDFDDFFEQVGNNKKILKNLDRVDSSEPAPATWSNQNEVTILKTGKTFSISFGLSKGIANGYLDAIEQPDKKISYCTLGTHVAIRKVYVTSRKASKDKLVKIVAANRDGSQEQDLHCFYLDNIGEYDSSDLDIIVKKDRILRVEVANFGTGAIYDPVVNIKVEEVELQGFDYDAADPVEDERNFASSYAMISDSMIEDTISMARVAESEAAWPNVSWARQPLSEENWGYTIEDGASTYRERKPEKKKKKKYPDKKDLKRSIDI